MARLIILLAILAVVVPGAALGQDPAAEAPAEVAAHAFTLPAAITYEPLEGLRSAR